MVFETSLYEWSHGKKPRGFGHWAFGTRDGDTVVWASGTLTEAKKKATPALRELGIVVAYVRP